MCSLDVCSLFTNVPLDETIDTALDKLYSLSDPPTLPRAVLQKLLEFATKKSHFLFDGQYYDQIDGVAMGSPSGPVLANIFMCHFEESKGSVSQLMDDLDLIIEQVEVMVNSIQKGVENVLRKQCRLKTLLLL